MPERNSPPKPCVRLSSHTATQKRKFFFAIQVSIFPLLRDPFSGIACYFKLDFRFLNHPTKIFTFTDRFLQKKSEDFISSFHFFILNSLGVMYHFLVFVCAIVREPVRLSFAKKCFSMIRLFSPTIALSSPEMLRMNLRSVRLSTKSVWIASRIFAHKTYF